MNVPDDGHDRRATKRKGRKDNGSAPSGSAADYCQVEVEDGRTSSTQHKDAEPADYDCAEKQVVLVCGSPAGDVLPEIAETVYLFGLLALLVTI